MSQARIGAEIMGRGTFGPGLGTDDEWRGPWGPNAPFHTPVFVSDLAEAVGAAKDAAGSQAYVSVLGADVGRQCLGAGLLDEILVFFAPVLLGEGTPMFAPTGTRVDLDPVADDPVHW